MSFNSADYAVMTVACGILIGIGAAIFGMWLADLYHRHCDRKKHERKA